MLRSSRGRPVRRRGSLRVEAWGFGGGGSSVVVARVGGPLSGVSGSSRMMGEFFVPKPDVCECSVLMI